MCSSLMFLEGGFPLHFTSHLAGAGGKLQESGSEFNASRGETMNSDLCHQDPRKSLELPKTSGVISRTS